MDHPDRPRDLADAFRRLKRAGRTALVPFIMGGDPSVPMTAQLLETLQDAGADVIEVGLPFSDPLADGPVIQAAAARALEHGATPAAVFDTVASVRARMHVPMVCLTYWNLIMQFGGSAAKGRHRAPEAFLRAAHACGIAGVIVPDLPVEEGRGFRAVAAREQLAVIFLAAPTSTPDRLRMIARASEGFIYYVSLTGTTGARQQLAPDLVEGIRRLQRITTKPVCVGFGISTPRQARSVARIADGVIVGSALIQTISAAPTRQGMLRAAHRFVASMRAVL